MDSEFDFESDIKKHRTNIQNNRERIDELWKELDSSIDKQHKLNKFSENSLKYVFDYHIGGGWGNETQNSEFTEPAFVMRGTNFEAIELGQTNAVPFRYH